MDLAEDFLELDFPFGSIDGNVLQGGYTAAYVEEGAFAAFQRLGDDTAACLCDIVEKAFLAGY